uniref:Uncharacterized protein n=1 Tax=Glossina brevipalpis TaxID=37001 RepID=A0A1A9WEN8_9MUSC
MYEKFKREVEILDFVSFASLNQTDILLKNFNDFVPAMICYNKSVHCGKELKSIQSKFTAFSRLFANNVYSRPFFTWLNFSSKFNKEKPSKNTLEAIKLRTILAGTVLNIVIRTIHNPVVMDKNQFENGKNGDKGFFVAVAVLDDDVEALPALEVPKPKLPL